MFRYCCLEGGTVRLEQLKYNLLKLPPNQQLQVFEEYYQKRERDLAVTPTFHKKKDSVQAKPKKKMVSLTTEQLELLKKLNLL